MAARAATFTYYPDVNDAQGPSRGCLQRQNLGGPICQNENPRVRIALNTLFHATNGYWWKNNMNWRTAENYCTWASVGCDDRDVLRSMYHILNHSVPSKLPSSDIWMTTNSQIGIM